MYRYTCREKTAWTSFAGRNKLLIVKHGWKNNFSIKNSSSTKMKTKVTRTLTLYVMYVLPKKYSK